MKRSHLGVLMTVLIWGILVLNFLAFKFYWYWIYPWFDMPMHFLGGLWLGGMIVWMKWVRWDGEVSRLKQFVWVILGAMAIGLAWEVFEFSLDTFIIFRVNDVADTLSDLSMDFVGAVVAYLIFLPRRQMLMSRREEHLPESSG